MGGGGKKTFGHSEFICTEKGPGRMSDHNSVNTCLFLDQTLVSQMSVSDFWHRSDGYSEAIVGLN